MYNIVLWFKSFAAKMFPPKEKTMLTLVVFCEELPMYGDDGLDNKLKLSGHGENFSYFTLKGSSIGYNQKRDIKYQLVKNQIESGDYTKIIIIEHEKCACYAKFFPGLNDEVLEQIQIGNLLKITEEAKHYSPESLVQGMFLTCDQKLKDCEQHINDITEEELKKPMKNSARFICF